MIYKLIATIAPIVLILSSCHSPSAPDYTISGEIRGLNNDSIVILIEKYGKDRSGDPAHVKYDTIAGKAENNIFHLQGTIDSVRPARAFLAGIHSNKSFSLFIEKGNLQVRGTIDSADEVKVTGTVNNDLYSEQNQRENKIYARVNTLRQRLSQQDTADKATHEQISGQMETLLDSIKNSRIRFVELHPDAMASGIYLYVLSDKIPLDKLQSLYNPLTEGVKASGFGMVIRQSMEGMMRTEIGKPAPEFSSPDTSGNVVVFSSFRGRYVLLDFWASWCVPCRAESPYLTAAYKKYKDKGFSIVSISMDNKAARWKDAIRKDHLDWTHLSDLKFPDNAVAELYGVTPIPDNFLIDPQGKIVARALRGDALDKTLSEIFK